MTRPTLGVVVLIAVLIVGAAAAAAQMYRWVDDQGNSHYSEGLDSVPERFRAAATRLRVQTAPTAGPAAPGDGGDTVLQFAPGKPIYVTAKINGNASVRLILDTGADGTVIAERALVAAGVSTKAAIASGKIRGATGDAKVEAFDIESLQVGNSKVGKMMVIAHDINDPNSDGLLGRDFLDQFKVTIDSAAGQVTLSPK